MKKNFPLSRLKIFLGLILITLVFCAFSKPDNTNIGAKKGKVYGKVADGENKSLQGASVIIGGTTTGMVTDVFGNYLLKSVPIDAELVISYLGFKTVKVKPNFDQPVNVKMEIAPIPLQKTVVRPEEETTTLSVTSDEFGITIKGIIDNKPPLYVMDGKVIEKSEFNQLNADQIGQISLLKDSSEIKKYGEKGKNGVITITSKKIVPAPVVRKLDDIVVVDDEVKKEQKLTIVEKLPEFPGGETRMMYYFSTYTKYPKQAKTEKVEGTVEVSFMVSKNGKVDKVKVLKGANPALDAEAVRVVSSMPYWTPGIQNGFPVEVYYSIPIEFNLQSTGIKSQDAKVIGDADLQGAFINHTQLPQFPGGEAEMMKFIKFNLKYPDIAKEKGVLGTVIVLFLVGRDGKISNIKVKRGIGSGCDEEAIRIVQLMPTWNPGKESDKAVDVFYTVPVRFGETF